MPPLRRVGCGLVGGILTCLLATEASAVAPTAPPASAFYTPPSPLAPSETVFALVPPAPPQPRWVGAAPAPPPRAAESACTSRPLWARDRRLRVVEGTLGWGQSSSGLLSSLGISNRDIKRMARDFRPWVPIGRLDPGHEVRAAFHRNGTLAWVRHRAGPREAYCGRRERSGRFTVLSDPIPVETRLTRVEGLLLGPWAESLVAVGERRALGLIAQSLFPKAAPRRRRARPGAPFQGEPPRVAVFRILVEKHFAEGRFFGYGAVPYIEVDFGDRVRRAVRFERGDAPSGYFTAAGRARMAAALRPPVLDGFMTSGYGRRRHPIRRRWRMHRGVDYGARRGTPVFAVESGRVQHAGPRGPLGILVVLEHAEHLATRYAHLDRVDPSLVEGGRVEAGDLLGYVGSSGLSTGPHLHFETLIRGKHRNPVRVRPGRPSPLTDDERERFEETFSAVRARLMMTPST